MMFPNIKDKKSVINHVLKYELPEKVDNSEYSQASLRHLFEWIYFLIDVSKEYDLNASLRSLEETHRLASELVMYINHREQLQSKYEDMFSKLRFDLSAFIIELNMYESSL